MAITVRDILLRFTGDQSSADAAIDDVYAHLKTLDGASAEADVKLAHDVFEAELARVNAELDRLGSRDVTAKVRLKLDDARADVERLAQDASLAFDRYFHAQGRGSGGLFTGLLKDAGQLAQDLEPLGRSLLETTSDVEQLSDKADAGAGFFSKFGDKVSQIQPIAGGLLVVLVVGLIPALVAVGASAIAAVGGLAALATAFVGTLLPTIAPVAAALMSITGVIKALLERSNAHKQAMADVGVAHQHAAEQAMQEHAQLIALRDARDAVTAAERHYADAVAAASKQIADARRLEQRAEESLADTRRRAHQNETAAHRRTTAANAALKKATKDAYGAWAQAVQDVTDKQLALENAQLGVLDAQDRLYTATNAYNSLLNQIPSDKIGDILKKFQDVNAPEDQIISYVAQIGGMSEGDAHKLYKAWLDLQHAQVDLKTATQDETKAQKDLNAAQDTANDYTQKGIKAYGPYNDAVKALTQAKRAEKVAHQDATRSIKQAEERLADAKRTLAAYIKEGVHGMPGVRDAADAVRHAIRHLADEQWNAKHKSDALNASLGGGSSTARRAAADWRALTPAQKDLGRAIDGIRNVLKHSGLGDLIVGGLATAIRAVSGLIRKLSPEFGAVAGGMGHAIGQLAKAATGPGAVAFFRAMAIAAVAMSRVGPRILIDFAKGLANVATAATPGLARLLGDIARGVAEFAKFSGTPAGQRAIGRLIDATFTWGKTLGQIIGMFSRLIGLALPFGNDLVKTFGKWADHLFRGKKGGDNVTRFFKDTIPFAKSLASFIGAVIKALIQVFEFAAPILKPIIDMGTSIVTVIGDIVGFLNKLIPAPLREAAGFIGSLFIGAPKILGWLGKLPGVLASIGRWVAKLGIVKFIIDSLTTGVTAVAKAAADVGKAIAGAIVDGAKAAFNLAEKLASWVGDAVSGAATWVAGVGGKLVDGIVGGLGDAAAFGGKVLKWVGDAISTAAGSVASAGGAVATWLAGGLGDIAHWGGQILSAIKKSIESAASAVGKGAISAGGVIATWILNGVKDAAAFGGKILHWIANAIRSAAGSVASVGGKIVSWIWSGIKAAASIGGRVLRWIEHGISAAAHGAASVGKKFATWLWNGIKDGLNFGVRLLHALGGIGGQIVKIGGKIAGWLWDGIKSLPGKILDGLVGAFNSIIRLWNKLSFKIGGTDLGPLGHLPSITINTPDIPYIHLADGGVASAATRALIGEEPGVREAIIPLKASVLAGIGAAIAAASPALAMSAPALAMAGSPTGAGGGGAGGMSSAEQHFHVHGHTQKVDPDPRTSAALLARELRKQGGSR